jgi:hypothetical protein
MLPANFWTQERNRLLAVLLPFVEETARRGVQAGGQQLRAAGIAFDSELANRQAAQWARQYTDDLLNQLGTTTERIVGDRLADWVETPGSTIQDLVEQLAPVVADNASRAEAIGITEVTRAYSEGQSLVFVEAGVEPAVFLPPGHPRCRCWPRVERLGSGVMVVVWSTNSDEGITCTHPIKTPWGTVKGCRALDSTIISEGPYLGRRV